MSLACVLAVALAAGPFTAGATAADQAPRPTLKMAPAPYAPGPSRSGHRMVERGDDGMLSGLRATWASENIPFRVAALADMAHAGLADMWPWRRSDDTSDDTRNDNGASHTETFAAAESHSPEDGSLMILARVSPAQVAGFDVDDPFETINRGIFRLNTELQSYVLDPFADVYYERTTPAVRASVRNVFDNLREPVTVVSAAMVGNLDDAGNAAARFGINSTIGIVGLFDPAADMGFPRRPTDLEEALCLSGLPPGPYVVLPILGPAMARDAVGRLLTVAAYFQVMGTAIYVPYRVSNIAIDYVDVREQADFIDAISMDPYVAHRTLYIDMRNMSCGKRSALDQYFTR